MAFTTSDKSVVAVVGLDKNSSVALDLDSSSKRLISVSEKVAPNGGFGWVVVSATFVISFIVSGFLRSIANLSDSIFAEFSVTSSIEVKWIYGMVNTISLVTAPVSGMLLTNWGFRVMVFIGGFLCSAGLALSYFATSTSFLICSLGIFTGVGISFALTSSVECVRKYFTSKSPAAISIVLSGGCIGAMVIPTVSTIILQALGMRFTFLVLSSVFALICILSVAFGPPEDHFVSVPTEFDIDDSFEIVISDFDSDDIDSSRLSRFVRVTAENLGLKSLSDPCFLITAASIVAMAMGNPHFQHYIPQQAKKLGLCHSQAVALLIYAAVGDLCARLIYGFVGNLLPISHTAECVIALIISGTAVTVIPFCTAYWQLIVISLIAGIGSGMCNTLILIVLRIYARNYKGPLSSVSLYQGLAKLIHYPVAEKLQTSFGIENVFFFMGSMISLAAVLIVFLHLCALVRNRKRQLVTDL